MYGKMPEKCLPNLGLITIRLMGGNGTGRVGIQRL